MISLSRLSGQRFALNADLIQRVDATPDTVVTLVDGTSVVVAEPVEEVVRLVVELRAAVVAASHDLEARQGRPDLRVVQLPRRDA
jgi:flagellar protein FlbD